MIIDNRSKHILRYVHPEQMKWYVADSNGIFLGYKCGISNL